MKQRIKEFLRLYRIYRQVNGRRESARYAWHVMRD